ncbi:MAG: UDP-N-acetylmuramoyl-L-alanine--D-glutamate ligase [Candidatus Omnitrophota bacterium]
MNLKNKKVVVLGLGKSGSASAVLLSKQGASVFASDWANTRHLRAVAKRLSRFNIKTELGKHRVHLIADADLIVVSPGIDISKCLPILKKDKHKPAVISEVELSFHFCPAPIVAVTGSNGKTTTTTLIGRIFKTCGRDVFVCGNIGNPLSEHVLKLKKDKLVVMEVSSFQLERIMKFRPKVGIILNVSSNHLDRHKNFNSYLAAKSRIFLNQKKTDYLILNFDDPITKTLAATAKANVLFISLKPMDKPGAFIKDEWICVRLRRKLSYICKITALPLQQEHNRENILAAVLVGKIFNLNNCGIKKAILNFRGLPHRCEFVRRINAVSFVNDAKSTSTDATNKALASIDKSTILISGGRDKGSDFKDIIPLARQKVKMIIAIGEAKNKIKNLLEHHLPIRLANTLFTAVKIAYQNAQAGDCVLFSPMCSSFDMFKNFEHRGDVFKKIVRNLAKTSNDKCQISNDPPQRLADRQMNQLIKK